MKNFGPGFLVAAAFIGPGTITTASLAGSGYGYTLVWALLFSVFATILFQEMSARLGLVTQSGLADAMRQYFVHPVSRVFVLGLVIGAIGIGNAAYEAGNLTGAGLGISAVLPGESSLWVLILGAVSILLLGTGKYSLIQNTLVTLVIMMSITFITTMVISQPDISHLFRGAFLLELPTGSELIVIALIGTTIVPYNLFLHSSLVSQQYQELGSAQAEGNTALEKALKQTRWDTGLSIGLGGLITLAIISTSAVAFFNQPQSFNATTMATQLEPLLGQYASLFFAVGLFAAGLTSSITAPLATAYAVSGVLGWKLDISTPKFKFVWLTIILIGMSSAVLGFKPLALILFAQATNGLLLPVIALFLLFTMNNKAILGDYTNGWLANTLGGIVVALVSALGLFKLYSLF
jgi:NRAMP (natural resistance-associated macrophage protein)-like metal ion transporter